MKNLFFLAIVVLTFLTACQSHIVLRMDGVKYPAARLRYYGTAKKPVLALQSDVLFDYDKAELKPSGEAVLDRVAMDAKKVKSVHVDAYTDLFGSEEYNNDLSQRRADVVAAYLESKGVSNLTAKGRGMENPVVSSGDRDQQAPNRRAIITLQK